MWLATKSNWTPLILSNVWRHLRTAILPRIDAYVQWDAWGFVVFASRMGILRRVRIVPSEQGFRLRSQHHRCVWRPQPGINFINVLLKAFTRTDPESVKFQLSRQYLFTLLGSVPVKASKKMLMKLTPEKQEQQFMTSMRYSPTRIGPRRYTLDIFTRNNAIKRHTIKRYRNKKIFFHPIFLFLCVLKIQSNLCTTTTLGTQK